MSPVKRIGSKDGRMVAVELEDGTKIFMCNHVYLALPGQEPVQIINGEHHQLIWDARDSFACKPFQGKRPNRLTEDEVAFFKVLKQKNIDELRAAQMKDWRMVIVPVVKAEWAQYPGGKFFRVQIAKNQEGDYRITKDAQWDMSSPKQNKLMLLVGLGKEHGHMVFEYRGKLWVRAYRHVVQGRPRNSYTPYYRQHTSPYSQDSRLIVMRRFKGEYIPFPPMDYGV